MKTFIVTYTVLLAPIINEKYPQYNDGYYTKTITEEIKVDSEDELYELFSDGEVYEKVTWKEKK